MNAMARSLALISTPLVCCAVLLAGCAEDHPTLAPARGGVIRGVVSDGSAADGEITVSAETIGNAEMAVSATTAADAAGRFALNLPNGAYRVFFQAQNGWSGTIFHGARGPVLAYTEADTVWVAGDEQELDFACGRVVFAVGLPPEFAGESMWCGVEPLDYSGPTRSRTGVVQDGLRVEMRFVPPGRYRPALSGGDYNQIYLPPTFDPQAADEIVVAAGEALTYAASVDALTSLGGSVTGSWQTFGFDAPRVEVWACQRRIADTTAAADGSFAVALLAGASVRLRVRIGGMYQWLGGADENSATVFDVATGQSLAGIDHVESGLECVMSGDLDDRRVYGNLYDGQGRNLVGSFGENDTLRFSNLPPGPVYLRLMAPNDAPWLTQYFDRRDSLAVADPIVIPPDGQIAHVVPVLVPGGRIRGRILDVLGLPPSRQGLEFGVVAAEDSLTVVQEYYPYASLYDEVTGEFNLNQIPDGTFRLRARTKQLWSWWPHAASFAGGGTVTVADHAEVSLECWQLVH